MTIDFYSHGFFYYDILIYDWHYNRQIGAQSRFYPIRHMHIAASMLKGGHYGR